MYLGNFSYLQTEDKFVQAIFELNPNIGKRVNLPFILKLSGAI